MGIKQLNGDYAVNRQGLFIKASDEEEILQRVLTCLKVKRGSFCCDKQLGSELFTLDKALCSEDTLKVYISEALACIKEVSVLDVKRNLDKGFDSVAITVSLLVGSKPFTVEV